MTTRTAILLLALTSAPALASGPGIFAPADADSALPGKGSGNFTPGTSSGLAGQLGAGSGGSSDAGLASGGGDSEDDRWLELNLTPTKLDGASGGITFVPTPGSVALIGAGLVIAARRRRR